MMREFWSLWASAGSFKWSRKKQAVLRESDLKSYMLIFVDRMFSFRAESEWGIWMRIWWQIGVYGDRNPSLRLSLTLTHACRLGLENLHVATSSLPQLANQGFCVSRTPSPARFPSAPIASLFLCISSLHFWKMRLCVYMILSPSAANTCLFVCVGLFCLVVRY